jgi:signal peptidase I
MAAAAEQEHRKSTGREYLEALLIAILFVNFARVFVFQAFKIPSGSMEDNLKIGDHLVVNKFIYGPKGTFLDALLPMREVRRGDIFVFRYPENPDVDYVKRVIGLPGDTIEVRNKIVYRNGQALTEPYVTHGDPQILFFRDQFGPFHVGPDQYFAMGDNRDYSADSRSWGTVPRGNIKGRPFMVYWSYEVPPPPQDASLKETVLALGRVVVGFFSHTRWSRTFFIVDSKYHYTPGIEAYGNE